MRPHSDARPPTTVRPGAAGPPPGYALRLVGGFDLERLGRPVPLATSSQRLVAYLALRERPVLRTHLGGILWPDAPEERTMGNLRSTLWRLRQPGLAVVERRGDQLALGSAVSVDVHRLADLARRILVDAAPDLDPEQVDGLSRAGDILPDWSDEWVLVERERFRQLRLHALERLCAELARAGRYGRAVEVCLAAVSGEPLRESAQRELIQVHLAEGNRIEALRQFEAYRRLMSDELGLEPSPQMLELIGDLVGPTGGEPAIRTTVPAVGA